MIASERQPHSANPPAAHSAEGIATKTHEGAAGIHPHLTGCDTSEPRATSFSEAGGSALTMPGVAQLADVGMNETIAVGPHATNLRQRTQHCYCGAGWGPHRPEVNGTARVMV